MHKILVPVDGSESSLRALAYAAARASEVAGTSLHVLVVHPTLRVYGELEIYAGRGRLEQLAAENDEQILRRAKAQLASSTVPCNFEAMEGEPAHIIAQQALSHGCDSIVMGTRGHGRIGTLVMGSVATKVVHLTQLPVTLVK